MSRERWINRAAALGRAAAFSMVALSAAGGSHPAQAQKLLGGVITGTIAAGPLPAFSVGIDPGPKVVRVHSPDLLVNALQNPSFTGRIMIPADVRWDLSGYSEIPLRSGVSLIGERGALGSRPLLYTTNKGNDYSLFDITGNDVRIEGLHIQGPAAGNRAAGQANTRGIFVLEDADHQLGRRVVITDNEIEQWSVAGVELGGVHRDSIAPGDYDPSWAVIPPGDAGLVQIEGNYIHDNAMDGLGYGVCVDGGAYVTIEGNVFDYNRHDVTSDGHAHSGYIARFNYVLQGGYTYDGNYKQHFDVHGTQGSAHDGGPAGEYYQIVANTIRGDQSFGFLGHRNRPALELRGRPAIGAFFDANIVVHSDFDSMIRMDTGDDGSLDDDNPSSFNLEASRNQYGTDHSLEIAAGDFDGDGRTDVFLATGTAWFYSRGGSQPWTYLQPSSLLTRDLAFADVDNDGITDVLWRSPNGTLSYWKSGRGNPIALTSVPVTVSELRFGDFDGDGKTDIFYTQGGAWNFWYSRTRSWGSPGGSRLPLSELLFGDFDGDGKTDILGVVNGHWSISSAGTQPWSSLNHKLTDSFTNAVVGDFDGTGRNDILFSDGGKWYISRGGVASPHVWRDGGGLDPYASLKSLLLGHFDGGRGTEIVSFQRQLTPGPGLLPTFSLTIGDRLVIWRAAGTVSAFGLLSPQDMR
jgi:hypothetical protein